MPSVDLNADVGEGIGRDDDELLLDVVTSASVACGVHAGDPDTMRRTVAAAARRGVVVGAHPSYPDREGFGRRPMDLSPAQVTERGPGPGGRARRRGAPACGTTVRYVKPHGALYHRMADDEAVRPAVADALADAGDLVLLAPAGSRRGGRGRVDGRAGRHRGLRRSRLPARRAPRRPRADPGAVLDRSRSRWPGVHWASPWTTR